jgi:hypothetical protein
MITEAEVTYAKNGVLVAMETLRGAWPEMADDWKAYTGGWCLGYSFQLDKVLTRFGVKLDDDPELERYLDKHYE